MLARSADDYLVFRYVLHPFAIYPLRSVSGKYTASLAEANETFLLTWILTLLRYPVGLWRRSNTGFDVLLQLVYIE